MINKIKVIILNKFNCSEFIGLFVNLFWHREKPISMAQIIALVDVGFLLRAIIFAVR